MELEHEARVGVDDRTTELAAADRRRQRGKGDVGFAREEVRSDESVAMLRILGVPPCRTQVVPDVVNASVRPCPENLLPHGDGGTAFALGARKGALVRKPGLVGHSGALAKRKELPRNRVHVPREGAVAVNRIDIEKVLGVFQEMLVYPGASLSVHARNVTRRSPAVRYHAHVRVAFLQPQVRLALHDHGLVVCAAEAKIPLVADLVVVDSRAVPRSETFAERTESPDDRGPHGVRPPDSVCGRRSHCPPWQLEDDRINRESVRLEHFQKFVRARELPAVRACGLYARHVRKVRARQLRATGDHGRCGEVAVAVGEPREVPVDAYAEGSARLLWGDTVEVHDGEARIDGRGTAVVRRKAATNLPHALGGGRRHWNLDGLTGVERNVHRQVEHVTVESLRLQRSMRGDSLLRGVANCEHRPFVLPFPDDVKRISRLSLDAQSLGLRRLEHAAQ